VENWKNVTNSLNSIRKKRRNILFFKLSHNRVRYRAGSLVFIVFAQRIEWIKAIRRRSLRGLEWNLPINAKICEKHFPYGIPSADKSQPGFVPTLFPKRNNSKFLQVCLLLTHFSPLKLFFERSVGGNCEAISDGAERVLNFSILYTHPHTHPYTHTPLHKTLLSTYMRRS
jgi:hypothetical protein